MTGDDHAWDPPAVSEVRRSYLSHPFAQWMFVVAIGCALFWPSTASLFAAWAPDASDDTYSHGYFVAAICCWLGWRRARRTSLSGSRPSGTSAVLLLIAGLAWLVAFRGGIQTVHQALLPLILLLSVATAFGFRFAMSTAIAICYLIFAIPVWSAVNGILQQMTVMATDLLLRITGITASVHGNLVVVPAGVFEIAGGCSGLHYFIVGLALGVLYGEINDCRPMDRARLVLLAMVVAIASNWLRVYGVILAGYLTDMQHYLIRVEHASFGWIVFAVSLVFFFLIARKWTAASHDKVGISHDGGSAPIQHIGLISAVLTMCVIPVLNMAMPVRAADVDVQKLLSREVPGWDGPLADAPSASQWAPNFVGYDALTRAKYSNAGAQVEVFTAAYARQEQGRELIGYENSLAGPWPVLSSTELQVGFDRELVVDEGNGISVIWYSYRIGELWTGNAFLAQAYYGAATLSGAPLSQVIAVRARCDTANCEAARAALRDFTSAFLADSTGL